MRSAIIDDKKEDREYLRDMIEKYFPNSHIALFENGEALIQDFAKGQYDLIFLDIYMEGPRGIEIAKRIRELDEDVRLVFVSVSNDFASESYAVSASYYLKKPFSDTDVQRMTVRLCPEKAENRTAITLPNGKSLSLHTIIYTSYFGHYVTIHLTSGGQIQIRCTQKNWENLLLIYPSFILCTKGVIVNLEQVNKLENKLFIMKNNDYVSISRRKYPEIKQIYFDFLIEKTRKGKW